MKTRMIALCLLAMSLLIPSCGPGRFLEPTDTPRATATLTPSATPTAQTPQTPTPLGAPTSTATATASYPKVSNGTYEIQVTEVLTSPRIGSDLVDLTVRFISNDPKLTQGSGNPIACGAIQDASGESWTAFGFGSVRQNGKLLHTFCEFSISSAATGLMWSAEGYPGVDLGL